MPETGDEHRVVDRRRDRVAPSCQKRRRDRARVAGDDITNSRVDRIAQVLHRRRVTQCEAAVAGRVADLNCAHREAGGADALKVQIAGKVVGAGPHRLQRRQEPRLQFDEAADRGRRALLHRQAHARQSRCAALAFHLGDAQHEAIGALALLVGLDKALDRRRIDRPCQDAMRDPRGFGPRHGEACRQCRDQCQSCKAAPTAYCEGGDDEGRRICCCDPGDRFMLGCEVKRDAGTERDRNPRHQPAAPLRQQVQRAAAPRTAPAKAAHQPPRRCGPAMQSRECAAAVPLSPRDAARHRRPPRTATHATWAMLHERPPCASCPARPPLAPQE